MHLQILQFAEEVAKEKAPGALDARIRERHLWTTLVGECPIKLADFPPSHPCPSKPGFKLPDRESLPRTSWSS